MSSDSSKDPVMLITFVELDVTRTRTRSRTFSTYLSLAPPPPCSLQDDAKIPLTYRLYLH